MQAEAEDRIFSCPQLQGSRPEVSGSGWRSRQSRSDGGRKREAPEGSAPPDRSLMAPPPGAKGGLDHPSSEGRKVLELNDLWRSFPAGPVDPRGTSGPSGTSGEDRLRGTFSTVRLDRRARGFWREAWKRFPGVQAQSTAALIEIFGSLFEAVERWQIQECKNLQSQTANSDALFSFSLFSVSGLTSLGRRTGEWDWVCLSGSRWVWVDLLGSSIFRTCFCFCAADSCSCSCRSSSRTSFTSQLTGEAPPPPPPSLHLSSGGLHQQDAPAHPVT